jgi:hypothetical protein
VLTAACATEPATGNPPHTQATLIAVHTNALRIVTTPIRAHRIAGKAAACHQLRPDSRKIENARRANVMYRPQGTYI